MSARMARSGSFHPRSGREPIKFMPSISQRMPRTWGRALRSGPPTFVAIVSILFASLDAISSADYGLSCPDRRNSRTGST